MPDSLWKRLRRQLEEELDPEEYRTWFPAWCHYSAEPLEVPGRHEFYQFYVNTAA